MAIPLASGPTAGEPSAGIGEDGTHGATITSEWARNLVSLECAQLPPAVLADVRRFVLDTVACGIAGVATEGPSAVLRGLGRRYGLRSGGAAVWGSQVRLPAAEAAMVNGTAVHAREMDEFGGCGHSAAVVIPAVLAVADHEHLSGRDVVAGIVAGFEVAGRALEATGGYKAHNDAGWHSTGTCGSLGAAAGVARALRLSESDFISALGIAGSFTGGIWSFIVDGAMTKRWHPGKAAHTGVQAAWIAQGGFVGPRFVMEAPWGGFVSTYMPGVETRLSRTTSMGSPFRIQESGLKPYASCRGTHSSIEALLTLMDTEGFAGDDIAAMQVHGDKQTLQMLGGRRIGNVLDAQFSLPYCLAVAAQTRHATVAEFDPPRMNDARLSDLMTRIVVLDDAELGEDEEPELEVRLRSGAVHRLRVEIAKGDHRNPLSDQEVLDKARSLASPIIGIAAFDELADAVERLADLDDVVELVRPTRPNASSG